jgi:hypothetical protein
MNHLHFVAEVALAVMIGGLAADLFVGLLVRIRYKRRTKDIEARLEEMKRSH